ncbi:hypothetical protein CFP65_5166 [Kitasatospora sp. MMS16-BH015]|nr:hypothetical protein CFP65_5166 [Kitasatospora sp. MMS16-BH015]
MQSSNIGLGRYGEEVAVRRLVEEGLCILERNWRCGEGELDIVALEGETLAVCEVKTRSERGFQQPSEAIDQAKAERLRRLAERWLGERWPVHFEALASLVPTGGPAARGAPAEVSAQHTSDVGSADSGVPGPEPGAVKGPEPPGVGSAGPGSAESAQAGPPPVAAGRPQSKRGRSAKARRGSVPAPEPPPPALPGLESLGSERVVPLPPGGVRIDLVAVVNPAKGPALVEHLRGVV